MNLPPRLPLLALAALSVASSTAVCAQGITRESPFGGTSAAPAAAPTENAPLELRGIVATTAGYMYGIFDPSKRLSSWVRMNDSGSDFVVRSHDEKNETITVEYQGRTLTLGLKAAKVESLGPAPNPMMQANLPRPANAPVAMNPSPADEARRLEGVAAEVRRRRMLRQQAAQQAAQNQQGPVPQPVPPGAGPVPQPR